MPTTLKRHVLDVLLDAAHKKECIGAAEISRRAGIYREAGGGGGNIASMNDAIVTGMLVKLFNSGKVEWCEQTPGGRGGWQLTSNEFNRRRDDV